MYRLLTLTGAGGSGKTRLALEAARASSGAYLDGTALVLLAAVADPDLVAPAIAQALGVHEIAGVPLRETLVAYLRPRTVLLVMDNFEHLLAAAQLISDLLAACRNLTVLATSREALRLQAEQELSVPPLELPPPDRAAPAANLLQCASVELFAQRSAQILPSFHLTSDTARIAADICLRLDGLPLAIELAAARIKVMSPAVLLEQAPKIGHAGEARRRLQQRVAGEVISSDLASDERLVQRRQRPPIVVRLVEATVFSLDHADAGNRNSRRVTAHVGRFALEEARGERLQQRGLAHAGRAHQQHQQRRARVGQDLAQLGVDADERRMRHAIAMKRERSTRAGR